MERSDNRTKISPDGLTIALPEVRPEAVNELLN